MKEQLMNYLVTSTGALTIQDVLLNFLVAAIIGAVIFLSYRISHAGAAYSARFNVSLVMLTLGALLGYRGDTLVPILAIFGAPIAVSSYTMAEQMDGDGELAASLVVLTTAFSILTMFLFIFALKQLGLV